MQFILSRLAPTAGFKEVSPAVQSMNGFVDRDSRVKHSLPGAAINAKNFAFGLGKVQLVPSVIGRPNLRPSIISMVVMFVVNVSRGLFACHQKISNAMSVILLPAPLQGSVPASVDASSDLSNAAFVSRFDPNQITRIRTVLQDFTDRFWYKFRSHVESPLSVVRGLVAATTSTPILTQRYSHV
jgi:hypothetical protein